MTAQVLKPFQVRRDGKIVQYQPGDRIPVKDPRKAEPLIRDGYIKPVPPDEAGTPVPSPGEYFRAVFISLTRELNAVWPILDAWGKSVILDQVDQLDVAWIAQDREAFDRIIRRIRTFVFGLRGVVR